MCVRAYVWILEECLLGLMFQVSSNLELINLNKLTGL